MSRPLKGWDLATWRISQIDVGLNPNIVTIMEIDGYVDVREIYRRVKLLVHQHPVLAMGVSDSVLSEIRNFNSEDFIKESTLPVCEIALDYLQQSFRENECLWRISLTKSNQKCFLVFLIHHAIADGAGAMGYLGALLDKPIETIEVKRKVKSRNTENSQSVFQNAILRLANDPLGMLQDINQLFSSFAKILPKSYVSIEKNSNAKQKLSIARVNLSTNALKEYADQNSVSVNNILMGIAILVFQNFSPKQKDSVIMNVPVAFDAGANVLNQIIVAKIELKFRDVNLETAAIQSRDQLNSWLKEPGLKIANNILDFSNLIPSDTLQQLVTSSDITMSTLRVDSDLNHLAGNRILGIWPFMNPLGAALNLTAFVGSDEISIGVSADLENFDFQRFLGQFGDMFKFFSPRIEVFEQIFE